MKNFSVAYISGEPRFSQQKNIRIHTLAGGIQIIKFRAKTTNTLVHNDIVKKYRKWIIEINSRFGTDFKVPAQARVTTITNVRPSGLDTTKYPHYPNTTPTYPNSYPKRGSPTEKR
ncbi:hypothetical protein QE152_g21567 [Popillia japonica]|uniref:Uncharacterized protein n=1 Tax=Popillia japonica TaxID=7064 RepID=A0AAW1KN71_POPJA